VRAPLSPRKLASGPSPAKPFADLALAASLARAHRRTPFDAVLAHNAEAALAALLVRPLLQRPVSMCLISPTNSRLRAAAIRQLRGPVRASTITSRAAPTR
jgi:hypothetical protein